MAAGSDNNDADSQALDSDVFARTGPDGTTTTFTVTTGTNGSFNFKDNPPAGRLACRYEGGCPTALASAETGCERFHNPFPRKRVRAECSLLPVPGLRSAAVEAVAGMTYWDYVQENTFGRCGMTGSAFYTRPQWLTDQHIAQPYMMLADGSQVDAVRNLDKSSPYPDELGENRGRTFIAAPGDAGFATAPDLVRFAHALGDGTVLDRPLRRSADRGQDPPWGCG